MVMVRWHYVHRDLEALERLESSLEVSSKTLQPLPAHISGPAWAGEETVPRPRPLYLLKRPTPSTTSLILLFS